MEALQDTELSRLDPAHRTPAPFDGVKSKYTGIFVEGQEDVLSPLNPGEHHPLHNSHWESERPPVLKTLVIQIFALLWLVPAGALLYLNFKHHVIGASAWCPFGDCLPRVYDPRVASEKLSAVELPAKFDRETHNLLGALQLAAKALEVWFIVIAGWLVYMATTILAARREGIPVGYFSRPTEFAEVTSLFDPLLWTTLRRQASSKGHLRKRRVRVYLFVVASIFLCFICNLMGPAVAVLVIPSLQWIQTKSHGDRVYTTTGAVNPPSAYSYLFADSQCYDADLINSTNDELKRADLVARFEAQHFSCAFAWSQLLDGWVDSSYAVAPQSNSEILISVQNATSFTYNATAAYVDTETATSSNKLAEAVFWSPSRQVLNSLSNDMLMVMHISAGVNQSYMDTQYGVSRSTFDSYAEYNSTVQTFLHRNGPIFGGLVNAWLGFDNQTHWTTMVDDDQWLKCYGGYEVGNAPLIWGNPGTIDLDMVSGNFTKCISVGPGWQDGYKVANFSLGGLYSDELEAYQPDLNVTIHSSGKAAFLPEGRLPIGMDDGCLVKNARVSAEARCDWDSFWQTGNDSKIKHRSKAVTTIEMLSYNNTVYNTAGDETQYYRTDYPFNTTLVMDFVAFEAFADYMLDPSMLTNPLLTANHVLKNASKQSTLDDADFRLVQVDPAWTVAAWTANAGQRMPSTATMSRLNLLNAFERFIAADADNYTNPALQQRYRIDAVGLMPIVQTLTMIDFNTTSATSGDMNDIQRPRLERFARVQVYAYGVSSRTGWMGIIVTSIGCIVVLLEVMLGFIDRRRFRSLTQLLVAALEHQYTNEFSGVCDEKTISRVPFRLRHDYRIAGRFKFEKVG